MNYIYIYLFIYLYIYVEIKTYALSSCKLFYLYACSFCFKQFASLSQPICPISTYVTSQFHRLLNSSPPPAHSPRPMHCSLYVGKKLSPTLAFSCAPTLESGISSETPLVLCQVTQTLFPTHVAFEIPDLSVVCAVSLGV